MAMAVSTKISLFTPVVTVSNEGILPAFWTNFLSTHNANSVNIIKIKRLPPILSTNFDQ